jgi:hypothetical protein
MLACFHPFIGILNQAVSGQLSNANNSRGRFDIAAYARGKKLARMQYVAKGKQLTEIQQQCEVRNEQCQKLQKDLDALILTVFINIKFKS